MKNIFVVDASLFWNTETERLSLLPLIDELSAVDFLLERLSFQDFSFIFLHTENISETVKQKFQNAGFSLRQTEVSVSLQDLLIKLKKIKDELHADNIAFTYADSPFLDQQINTEIIKMHLDNEAEYTFADNLPDGLSVELCSSDFLDEIISSAPKQPELLSRKIFDNVQADINQFYAEVYLPDDDISLKRIEFHSNTKRNFALLTNILQHSDRNIQYQNIVNILAQSPEVLFIHPKYAEIEITNKSRKCFFCPQTERPEIFLAFDDYKKIIEKLTDEYDDVIVALTGIGNPLYHPDFLTIAEYTIKESRIFSFIIETTAENLTEEISAALSEFPVQKLQIIFKIDAVNEQTYSKLHEGRLDIVMQNIEQFLQISPENKSRTFVQFTKMQENIEEMEPFYRFWQQKGVSVIIQKYNDYAGVLKNRTISDLTPLDRLPCWHLQRDLTVLADGRVPVCKQDFDGQKAVGNLLRDSLSDIQKKILPYYLDNYMGKFEKLPLCRKCDEWYTYNF